MKLSDLLRRRRLEPGRTPLGSIHRINGRRDAEQVLNLMGFQAVGLINRVLAERGANGYCRGCGQWGPFEQAIAPDWTNVIEGLLCQCGLNSRMRGILGAIDALLSETEPQHVAVFERLTPMFEPMRRRLPSLTGSEYLGDHLRSGDQVDVGGVMVRHESLLATSYASDSLDLVMHYDVLEHVPDPVLALAECRRVLKPGGWLLFSTPFYEQLNTSIVRARLVDGALQHDLPPCFHGNPVDGGGALVFTQFGWDLLDMMSRAGFAEPEMWLSYNPAEGVLPNGCPYPDGHVWPFVFAARK